MGGAAGAWRWGWFRAALAVACGWFGGPCGALVGSPGGRSGLIKLVDALKDFLGEAPNTQKIRQTKPDKNMPGNRLSVIKRKSPELFRV